jgi:hypothetical protein
MMWECAWAPCISAQAHAIRQYMLHLSWEQGMQCMRMGTCWGGGAMPMGMGGRGTPIIIMGGGGPLWKGCMGA